MALREALPVVSVITPTLDRVGLLRRAVDSVLAQTYGDLEIVVVVDGPSAASAEFAAAHPDPRVRLVQREGRGGAAAARNTGIAASRGRYIGFLDDDDIWLPTKLERQVPLLDAGADVVHSLVYVADESGRVYERVSERGFRLFREVAAAGYPYAWLLRRSSYHISSLLVRREAVEGVGGFHPALQVGEDLDFVHDLWRRYELHLVDEPLTKYCFHSANTVRTTATDWVQLAAKELAWIAEADPPGRVAAEAYLLMQLAQAGWISGRYREAVGEALRARRLDPTVLSLKTLIKYIAAAVLPARIVSEGRRRTRPLRESAEPDPWIDLPTGLPIR